MTEYKTGEARFNLDGDTRYFIETVGEDYPRARLYASREERDRITAAYRAGEPWGTEPGYAIGETNQPWGQSNYTLVSYDEPERQFRLFYNTEHPDGFIITNSEAPGEHWQGTFGDIQVRGVNTLYEFRNGVRAWGQSYKYRNLSQNIGHEYIGSTTETVTPSGIDLIDAEAKLENLWNALAAEAKERGWCDEFDTFAAANGAPERLFKSKVRLTIELEVDSREPTNIDINNALDALTGAELGAKITNTEVL